MGSVELTHAQKSELAALSAMSDDDIDTSDIPEIREFSNRQVKTCDAALLVTASYDAALLLSQK